MTSFIQVLVDRSATAEEASGLGDAAVLWLRSNGVVAAEPRTNAALVSFAKIRGFPFAEESGWPPGPRYEEWVDDPDPTATRELSTAWCTVELGRQVHAFADGGHIDPRCPLGHPGDDVEARAAVSDWFEGEDVVLRCAACGLDYDITAWDLGPEVAIGNLALRFEDWGLLRGSLVAELEAILAPHATRLIVGRI
jgi:hypothetical protein